MYGNIIKLKRSNHSMWETCTSCSITDCQTKSTYMNEYASWIINAWYEQVMWNNNHWTNRKIRSISSTTECLVCKHFTSTYHKTSQTILSVGFCRGGFWPGGGGCHRGISQGVGSVMSSGGFCLGGIVWGCLS